MNVVERFLKYVSYDTMSDPHSETYPTSLKQLELGKYLSNITYTTLIITFFIITYLKLYNTIYINTFFITTFSCFKIRKFI